MLFSRLALSLQAETENQMNNSKSLYYIFIIIAAAVMYSCANIGNPSGGPIDKTPPIFMRSNPTPNAVNVKDRKIEIFFDEIVTLKDPSTKIIVSPAQTEMPRMSALGRKVTVELVDSLLPNTTYTIDFSNSIQDNNEGNAIDNFAFALLYRKRHRLDARVGLRARLPHSGANAERRGGAAKQSCRLRASHKEKLQRVALTNDRGQFTIRNVSPGSYHIFALKDLDRDYKFGNPTEDIAFLDSIIVPSIGSREAADTVYNDLNEIDTIMRATRPAYFPNDILLSMFNEDRKSQYLANNLRVDSTRISLTLRRRKRHAAVAEHSGTQRRARPVVHSRTLADQRHADLLDTSATSCVGRHADGGNHISAHRHRQQSVVGHRHAEIHIPTSKSQEKRRKTRKPTPWSRYGLWSCTRWQTAPRRYTRRCCCRPARR